MKKRYVLKNKRRFYTITITILVMAFTCIFASTAYSFKEKDYKTITVKKGDTLWSIAAKHSNGEDIRKYIYEIKKVNSLHESLIYEGDRLVIPQ
jgi:hypothetical protein